MANKNLWLWLTSIPGIDSKKITRLLDSFDSVSDIYAANKNVFKGIDGINEKDITGLTDKSMDKVSKILHSTSAVGAKVLTYDDAAFPQSLRYCFEPPYVLYVLGNTLEWDRLFAISVVGTRNGTDYGAQASAKICYDLAHCGTTIVSGMARGNDTLAHNGALKAGGKTIAILGCGIDVVYPPENEYLMKEIIKNGAVITEYPPGTEPAGKNFPQRNRLIAAFSQGTLVIEAPVKSGALITAALALEMGKDVYALPGDYNRHCSKGCNELIKSGAAKLITSALDILNEYPEELTKLGIDLKQLKLSSKRPIAKSQVNTVKKITLDAPEYSDLSDDEKAIVGSLIEKNLHFDEICLKSGLDAATVGSSVTLLEMKGLINQLPGKNFSLKL